MLLNPSLHFHRAVTWATPYSLHPLKKTTPITIVFLKKQCNLLVCLFSYCGLFLLPFEFFVWKENTHLISLAYSEPCPVSKIKRFEKIVKGFIFAKRSILDVWIFPLITLCFMNKKIEPIMPSLCHEVWKF